MKTIGQKAAAALALLLLLQLSLAACSVGTAASPGASAAATESAAPSQTAAEPVQTGSLNGDPDAIKYVLKDFTLYLPADWKGHYTIQQDENSAAIYSTENVKAGYDGFVFQITCTDMDLSEGDAVFLDFAHGNYLWLEQPHDVTCGEQQDLMDEYGFLARDVDEIAENITVNPEAPSHYTYRTEEIDTKRIRICYPQFTDLGQAQEGVNQLVRAAAFQSIKDMNSDDEDWITLHYRVTYNTGGLISVVYDGRRCDKKSTIHYFLYTVNIDAEKQTLIRLKDVLSIDDKLFDLLKNGTCSSTDHWPDEDAFRSILRGKSGSDWMNELQGADGRDQTYASTYFTEEAMVFALPGNDSIYHVEVSVDYGDLVPFKTDSPVWDGIATSS